MPGRRETNEGHSQPLQINAPHQAGRISEHSGCWNWIGSGQPSLRADQAELAHLFGGNQRPADDCAANRTPTPVCFVDVGRQCGCVLDRFSLLHFDLWVRDIGLLINTHATRVVTVGMAANLLVTAVLLFVGVQARFPGIVMAAVALNCAACIELIILWRGVQHSLRVIGERPVRRRVLAETAEASAEAA